MEVSTAILALADPIVASILVANASIPIGNVQFSIYFLTYLYTGWRISHKPNFT